VNHFLETRSAPVGAPVGAPVAKQRRCQKKNTFQKISHNFMDSLQNQAKKITTNIKIEICLFLFDTVRI
jgi:hypothetical protein